MKDILGTEMTAEEFIEEFEVYKGTAQYNDPDTNELITLSEDEVTEMIKEYRKEK